MFEALSSRLVTATKSLTGRGRITEANVSDTARQIRMALLEADVALDVARGFVARVKERALGQAVIGSLNPGQAFTKVVHEELTALLGGEQAELSLRAQPPVVVLLVGLQGAGKTTTSAKLARWLKEQHKRRVAVASLDVYRPAAVDQLRQLADQIEVDCIDFVPDTPPPELAAGALTEARQRGCDVVILDSAGRLHVDDDMMAEAKAVAAAVSPHETLFVVDSLAGQDAVNSARAFDEALALTGVILTKTDGDSRGGVALSVREVTGKPIKFVGEGEKLDALAAFHPERFASRILGMGDVLTLVEDVQQRVDEDKAKKLARKVTKGKGLNLEDFRDQLAQIQALGGLDGLMAQLPGVPPGARMPPGMGADALKWQIALINAMTPRERRFPHTIDGSRKRRIAQGAGRPLPELNRLLKQHKQMSKMLKKVKGKGGMARMMGQLMNRGGGGLR